jgi:hypothetical protein
LRSAIDATSEVEMRDKMRDFVIGVFAKPDASIFACSVAQRSSCCAGYFVNGGANRKWTDFYLTCIHWIRGRRGSEPDHVT